MLASQGLGGRGHVCWGRFLTPPVTYTGWNPASGNNNKSSFQQSVVRVSYVATR